MNMAIKSPDRGKAAASGVLPQTLAGSWCGGFYPFPTPLLLGAPSSPAWPLLGPSPPIPPGNFLESTSSVPAVCSCLLINKASPTGAAACWGGREGWELGGYGCLGEGAVPPCQPARRQTRATNFYSQTVTNKKFKKQSRVRVPSAPGHGGAGGGQTGNQPLPRRRRWPAPGRVSLG